MVVDEKCLGKAVFQVDRKTILN